MSLSEVELGQEVTKDNRVWRIVRITKQHSLFESQEGVKEIVTEHLLELKDTAGEISFHVLSSERTEYTGPVSTIKAPEPLKWRDE